MTSRDPERSICLVPIISETVGDRDLMTIGAPIAIGYHVADDVTPIS